MSWGLEGTQWKTHHPQKEINSNEKNKMKINSNRYVFWDKLLFELGLKYFVSLPFKSKWVVIDNNELV